MLGEFLSPYDRSGKWDSESLNDNPKVRWIMSFRAGFKLRSPALGPKCYSLPQLPIASAGWRETKQGSGWETKWAPLSPLWGFPKSLRFGVDICVTCCYINSTWYLIRGYWRLSLNLKSPNRINFYLQQ